MRVLLAYRCHDEGVEQESSQTVPAGLLWLAAALRAAGHAPVVANFSRLGWKDVERYVADVAPDVVGVSFFTPNRRVATRLVRLARRTHPGVFTIAGGPHATALAAPLLERVRELDVVVLGEGEQALVAACNALAAGGRPALGGLPGLALRGFASSPAPTADPAMLAVPDADLPAAGLIPVRDLRHVVASRRREGGAAAAALRRPASVAREVRALRDAFGLVEVSLVGPGLVGDRHFLTALADAFRAAKVGVAWEMETTVDELVPEGTPGRQPDRVARELRAAHGAGCRRVRITLDAGDVGEGATPGLADRLARASRALRLSGIAPHLTVRFGTPDQDRQKLDDLRALVRAFRPRKSDLELRQRLPVAGVEDANVWFEDATPVIPDASPRQVELAQRALELTLREVRRSAQPAPRDFAAAESALGSSAWIHLDWGDYRASLGDAEEAERRYRLASGVEPWNPVPWLSLAALHARGPRPAPDREVAALREALNRVPRHEAARARLEELRDEHAAERPLDAERPPRGTKRERAGRRSRA